MNDREMGRFDKSFVFRMIRDFFFMLLVVIFLELAINLGLLAYGFATEGEQRTRVTAERLASDLKDVMLNRGGPVAARTVYPTWQRMYDNLGFEIALVPSEATKASIEQRFDFAPKGIPADFPEGRHHEATVTLTAEPFCTNCHVEAMPGDALGRVTVRSYFSSTLAQWVEDARTTAVVGMVNIIVSTIILYLLLKARMAPLLGLRATVSRLAKGRLDLSYRAGVRSQDEFGELALDLNHFLDRMTDMCEELRAVLTGVTSLNEKVNDAAAEGDERLEALDERARRVLERSAELQRRSAAFSVQSLDAMDLVVSSLEVVSRDPGFPPALRDKVQEMAASFRATAGEARVAFHELEALNAGLSDLSRDLREYAGVTRELGELSGRMQAIAESGQALLARVGAGSTPEPGERGA